MRVRSLLLGMWTPSLPFVMRRRWTVVPNCRASRVYRSEATPLVGRETSSGRCFTGLPTFLVSLECENGWDDEAGYVTCLLV